MIPKATFSFRAALAAMVSVVVCAAGGPAAMAALPFAGSPAPAATNTPATQSNGAAPVSFAGTWRLDADASEINGAEGLYGLGGSAPENLYVTQARNGSLVLSSKVNGAQPRWYIIGGENALPAPGGELERMTVASRWEGATLINEGTGELDGAPVVVYEAMSLSDDGDTLRMEIVTTVGGAATTNRLVYRRAPR